MGTAVANATGLVLNNVVVHTPGKKFVQKPNVIGTIDFSKVKYAPTNTKGTDKTAGGLLSKFSNSLKSTGQKLTKLKGSKWLYGAIAGGLLLGAAALISKCSGSDKSENKNPIAEDRTAQQPVEKGNGNGKTNPTPPPTENGEAPNVTPALPGERKEGAWSSVDSCQEMVCKDASGRTQDIKGKLEIKEGFEKNPDEFTITDSSSSTSHAYKYQKIGVNEKGQPIYKCVSMNDTATTTENQYTLIWENDKTPMLLQTKKQDNYGIGLKFEKKPANTNTSDNVEVWINRQPGPGRKPSTLNDFKRDVISACKGKRPLTTAEQEQVNKCKNTQEITDYLKSIGINLGIAF